MSSLCRIIISIENEVLHKNKLSMLVPLSVHPKQLLLQSRGSIYHIPLNKHKMN